MNEKSISQKQLFFVIFQSQIGIGLLSLPNSVHKTAESDGWLSILLAGICIQALILLMWLLLRGFEGKNIFEISNIVFGKYLGKFINLLYVTFFLLVFTLLAFLFANLIKLWILMTTPFPVLILLLLTVGIYIGKNNLRIIARFYTLATGIVLLSIILPWFSFTTNFQFTYLLPIGQSGLDNIVFGTHDAIVAMIGFELMLVILPYIEGTYKQSLKSISLASMVSTLFYVYFTVSCYLVFSPAEIKIIPQPVLYVLKAIDFDWIERLDLIFLSIWIIPMTTSAVTYLYLARKGAAYSLHKGQNKYPIWYLTIFVFIVGLFVNSGYQIEQFDKYVSLSSYLFLVFIPLLTLVVAIIRKQYNYRSSTI